MTPRSVELNSNGPLTSVEELVAAGLLPPAEQAQAEEACRYYPLRISPHILSLIERENECHAISAQFVPSPLELILSPEELVDPIGDESHLAVKGIVHRYPDRLILQPVLSCAAYCRFCFRRGRVGRHTGSLSEAELEAAFEYIRAQDQVWEVILSGGDPLSLSSSHLGRIVSDLSAIPHVGVIRIHTRIPITAPEVISQSMIAALKDSIATFVVIHCNHPAELTPEVVASCAQLVDAGIPLLSQTVLLKGVNDDSATMSTLLRALVRARVKPYYLHHADLAVGTSHFRTSIAQGQELMRSLRGRLSGICQPTYVLDIPGGYGKVPIGPNYAEQNADGNYTILDYEGRKHPYPFTKEAAEAPALQPVSG